MKRYKTIIPKAWDIPEVFRSRLGEDVGRQRLMEEEGHFLVILHQVPTHAHKDTRHPALFWLDTSDNWKSMPDPGGITALKLHVESYINTIRELDGKLDKANDPQAVFSVIEDVAPLLRATRNMLDVLQDLREALEHDGAILQLRDLAIKAERSADLLINDAKSTLDFQTAASAAKQANEAAKSAKEASKLNRLAALFFPTVTLASIFGMNPPAEVLNFPNIHLVLLLGAGCGLTLWFILKRMDKR